MGAGQGYNPYRDGNGKFTSPENVGKKVESDYQEALEQGDELRASSIENYAMEKMPESEIGRRILEQKYGVTANQKKPVAKASRDRNDILRDYEATANNPGLHQYGFPEDELVRHNVGEKLNGYKKELEESLKGTELEGHGGFVAHSLTITPRDRREAIEELSTKEVELNIDSSSSPNSWKAVMGDRRKTAKARAEYRNAIAGALASSQGEKVDELAKEKAQFNAFSRTIEGRETLPEPYQKAFQEIWDGDGYGSKAHTKKALKRTWDLSKKLKDGEIAPSKIVGTGYKDSRKVAEEYLRKEDERLSRDLNTNGTSNAENVRKVLKKAKAEGWPLSDGKLPTDLKQRPPRRLTEREKVAENYGHLSVDELHGIQRVHIDDYNRIKKELDAAGEVYRSGKTNSQEARKNVEELARRKVAVLETINSFGHLIDSKDGTIRS